MPVYAFQCDTCGEITEAVRPVERRDEVAACRACGASARRVFTPQVQIRQPCADWTRITARTILGPKSERVVVTKGAAKIPPRV